MSRGVRRLLRLWYCDFRGVHDFTRFGVGKPYEFHVCSLCDLRRDPAFPERAG